MRVEMGHYREQGIDIAVFNADAPSRTRSARGQLLASLTLAARRAGLRVSKAALAFREGGRTKFYGAPDLVRFLSRLGRVPPWTHELDV